MHLTASRTSGAIFNYTYTNGFCLHGSGHIYATFTFSTFSFALSAKWRNKWSDRTVEFPTKKIFDSETSPKRFPNQGSFEAANHPPPHFGSYLRVSSECTSRQGYRGSTNPNHIGNGWVGPNPGPMCRGVVTKTPKVECCLPVSSWKVAAEAGPARKHDKKSSSNHIQSQGPIVGIESGDHLFIRRFLKSIDFWALFQWEPVRQHHFRCNFLHVKKRRHLNSPIMIQSIWHLCIYIYSVCVCNILNSTCAF